MPESIYERANIVAEVQNRFARKQGEIGDRARQTQVAMEYFTGPLGAEPITRLLKQTDPNAVAMHMRDAYLQLRGPERAEFVTAVGYGVAGVLGYTLGMVALEPWKTEEFFGDSYDLFFANAHLNRPRIEAAKEEPDKAAALAQIEANVRSLDAETTQAVRGALMPGAGKAPGKIGDFFRSYEDFQRLPSVALVVSSWIDYSLPSRVLEAGQTFQAAIDAITTKPPTRPPAKNFLKEFGI